GDEPALAIYGVDDGQAQRTAAQSFVGRDAARTDLPGGNGISGRGDDQSHATRQHLRLSVSRARIHARPRRRGGFDERRVARTSQSWGGNVRLSEDNGIFG